VVETPNTDCRNVTANDSGGAERALEVEAWFVREVLPLEAVLIQFLSRSGRSKADVEDLRQDVYMRVCAAAAKEIPNPARPLVFTIARNLLIDRLRHEQVVPIDMVENLDVLNVAIDERTPDRAVIAREELRKFQAALEKLPERERTVISMQKIEGLSTREIAERTGIPERTVRWSLNEGFRALAELMLREPADIRRVS
jgi:RNA polymerase sigma-70 factor (ECF subfamily)